MDIKKLKISKVISNQSYQSHKSHQSTSVIKVILAYLPECGDPESLRWSNGPQRNRLGECLRGCTNLNGPRPLAKFCKSKSDSDPDSDESNPSNKLFEVDDPIFRPEVEEPEMAEAANDADVDDDPL